MDSDQCSSGCESGWTLYLEQSFLSNRNGSGFVRKSSNFGYNKVKDKDGIEQVNEEEEEEDLSMVSDASSGPSHYFQHHHHHHQDQQVDYSNINTNNYEDNKPCFFINNSSVSSSSGKRGSTHKINGGRKLRESCGTKDAFLDDTASSPLFNFSNIEDLPGQTNNQTGSMESVLDYSQGFSATHFEEERPAFQDSFGFLQQSSLSGNQHKETSGRLKGRRWK
ncbi:protein SOB FIVE-LIKE 5 [Cannabis sativa]|uniref:protein SOB FIVE-LIKE 5 n=1 Tax=Cannabis sativa TaxID=3483 RepID=UPI0029C9EC81|nr:protein SOB FIVE-LIKE 5 [Cannabis sativa]